MVLKRMKQTRKKGKMLKRVCKNKSRRHKRHTKCRNHRHKSQKQQGGNYAEDVTKRELDGMPIADDAVITIPGYPSMDAGAFKKHAEYRDFQGEEQ
jgi:hypothetical protein